MVYRILFDIVKLTIPALVATISIELLRKTGRLAVDAEPKSDKDFAL